MTNKKINKYLLTFLLLILINECKQIIDESEECQENDYACKYEQSLNNKVMYNGKTYKENLEEINRTMTKAKQNCLFFAISMGCNERLTLCNDEGVGSCLCEDKVVCRWKGKEPTNDDCPCDYNAYSKYVAVQQQQQNQPIKK